LVANQPPESPKHRHWRVKPLQEVRTGAGAGVFFTQEKNLESVIYVELEEGKDKDRHGFGFASSK